LQRRKGRWVAGIRAGVDGLPGECLAPGKPAAGSAHVRAKLGASLDLAHPGTDKVRITGAMSASDGAHDFPPCSGITADGGFRLNVNIIKPKNL
jgi:hypothetical protein